jgi:hypothetical protein
MSWRPTQRSSKTPYTRSLTRNRHARQLRRTAEMGGKPTSGYGANIIPQPTPLCQRLLPNRNAAERLDQLWFPDTLPRADSFHVQGVSK